MKTEHLFPWVVCTEQLSAEKIKLIKDEIEINFSKINNLLTDNTWGDNVTTTHVKCKCIISKLNLNNLRDAITPLVVEYYSTLNLMRYTEVVLEESWINIVPPSGFQSLHVHAQNFISGTIYLDAPENSGDIQFLPSLTEEFKGTKSYPAVDGMVVVFHGLLPHRVTFNRTKFNRISLSFNFKLI